MTTAPFSSGTDDHPEVAEISDLTEGLLPPEQSTELRTHLAECTLCADVRASLDEIRSTLGTLPGPVRMPDDVAGRIDAALAAEALLDATAPTPAGAEPGKETEPAAAAGTDAAHSVSRETGNRAVRVSRETAADRPAGRPRGATGPGTGPGTATGPGPGSRRPRRWRRALLASVGAVAVLGIGGAVLQGISVGGKHDAGGKTAAQDAGDTKQNGESNDALRIQVRKLLDKSPAPLPEGNADETREAPSVGTKRSPGSPGSDAPMRGSASTVPSCVRESLNSGAQPLAVDASATYQGKDSYLVLLPHPGDNALVDAYVVDAACTTGAAPGPGELLAKRIYARN